MFSAHFAFARITHFFAYETRLAAKLQWLCGKQKPGNKFRSRSSHFRTGVSELLECELIPSVVPRARDGGCSPTGTGHQAR